MNQFAWQTVRDNHQSALDTCKKLIKENRLDPARAILKLAEKNISNLEKTID